MAQVVWKPRAIDQLHQIIDYSVPEFGMVAFTRLEKQVTEIIRRLEKYPQSYSLEPLLDNDQVLFRSCPLRKRHKMIYHWDEASDTVFIDDIWDVRMNPDTLRKRFL